MSDTRADILEVARRLFTEQGYDRTPLREIADELGITKAALYYHFASKESLLEAMLEPAFAFLRELIGRFDPGTGPAGWVPLVDELIDWSFDQRSLFALLERNHDTLERLLHEPESMVQQHHDLHDALNRALTDPALERLDRIRFITALAVATSMFTFGSSMLDTTTGDDAVTIKKLVGAVLFADLG